MNTLILLPKRDFHDKDLLNFVEIVNDKTYIATQGRDIAIGKYGTKVIPDFSFESILKFKTNPFDRIVLIADEGWKELYIPEIKTIVAGFMVPQKEIIAISLAPITLAKFGFLAGKIITFNYDEYPKYEHVFYKYGARVTTFPVFKDGNIATCKGRDSIFLLKKYI